MRGDRRLRILVAGHFLLGLLVLGLSFVPNPTPLGLDFLFPPRGLKELMAVPLLALVVSQAELMALWIASSGVSPWKRAAGLVVGAAYLDYLLITRFGKEFVGLNSVAIVVTTVALLISRALGLRVAHRDDPGQASGGRSVGLGFSIRGLMALSAGVAILSAVTRSLPTTPARVIFWAMVLAFGVVAVGLVCFWAGLGSGRPIFRVAGPIVLSPVLGASFANAVEAHTAGWVYLMLVMMLYPMALLASLAVVRSCGYRLIVRAAL